MRRFILPILGSLLGLGLTTAPAVAADGTGQPVFTSPTQGQTVPAGWTGPLTIDFSAATPGSYDLMIECPDTYREVPLQVDESTTTRDVTLAVALPSGGCTASVTDHGSSYASVSFTVAQPVLTNPSLSLNRTTFYPRVVDGYLDNVTLSTTLNRSARVFVDILNSSGELVRRTDLGIRSKGTHPWTWNGRRADGSLFGLGNYRFRVVATADGTARVVASPLVTLATKTVWQRKNITKFGNQGTAATSGNCFVEPDDYDRTAHLDCWGGNYARVTYGFGLPAAARNVVFGVASYDTCCDGSFTRTGTRVNSTLYRVRVQVGYWQGRVVERVTVGYDYPRVY